MLQLQQGSKTDSTGNKYLADDAARIQIRDKHDTIYRDDHTASGIGRCVLAACAPWGHATRRPPLTAVMLPSERLSRVVDFKRERHRNQTVHESLEESSLTVSWQNAWSCITNTRTSDPIRHQPAYVNDDRVTI
jgi:hypothetical protein